jgi:hypothetical protein
MQMNGLEACWLKLLALSHPARNFLGFSPRKSWGTVVSTEHFVPPSLELTILSSLEVAPGDRDPSLTSLIISSQGIRDEDVVCHY